MKERTQELKKRIMMKSKGLARIVNQPQAQEYHLAQFLGEQPATVPTVLSAELRGRSEDNRHIPSQQLNRKQLK